MFLVGFLLSNANKIRYISGNELKTISYSNTHKYRLQKEKYIVCCVIHVMIVKDDLNIKAFSYTF